MLPLSAYHGDRAAYRRALNYVHIGEYDVQQYAEFLRDRGDQRLGNAPFGVCQFYYDIAFVQRNRGGVILKQRVYLLEI